MVSSASTKIPALFLEPITTNPSNMISSEDILIVGALEFRASTIGNPVPVSLPRNVSCLFITTFSLYVPLSTIIVSPG